MNKTTKWFIVILFLALALRAYNLDQKEFGTDEKWTLAMTDQILDGSFFENVGSHAHPPLFYTILAPFWFLSNKSILFMKSIMVFFGLLSIFATFLLAKKLFNEKIALLSAFLLAISPFHIMYSQHIRSYIFLMCLLVFSLILLINYIKERNHKLLIPLTILYIVAFYAHIFAAFFVVSQIVALLLLKLFKFSKIKLKHILYVILITSIGWAFWIPSFLQQFKFNITEGAIVTLTTLQPLHVPYVLYKYAVAMNFSAALQGFWFVILLAFLLIVLVFFGLFKLYKESKPKFIIIATNLFLPTLLLAFLGIFFPIFSFKYVSYLVPLFMVLLAKGFFEIKDKRIRWLLLLLTIFIWFVILNAYWDVFLNVKWGHNFAI